MLPPYKNELGLKLVIGLSRQKNKYCTSNIDTPLLFLLYSGFTNIVIVK